MRIGFAGSTDDVFTRIWSQEMAARGAGTLILSEAKPDWDVEWAPLRPKTPLVKGLGLGRVSTAAAIREACADSAIDVLHVQQLGVFAALARLSGHHPLMLTPWGSDVLRIREWPLSARFAIRYALRGADAVTCCAPHIREAVISLGAPRERCHDIGWGVDEHVHAPDEADRHAVRAAWGIDEDDLVILSTRRLEALYRIDVLMRAFAHVLSVDPDSWLVVGSYGSQDSELKALAEELSIGHRVRFLGRLPESGWPSMASVYRAGDVYCSIPWSDGAPLSVLEALSTGLPVVAADLPSMRDWISKPGAGLVWSGGDVRGLSALILEAYRERESLGRSGRRYVLEHQSRRQEMDRALELSRRLAGEAP